MTASDHAVKLASIAALAADEKLAQEIAVVDVSEQLVIPDCLRGDGPPGQRHCGRG